jgi:predicted Zn-dependent protease
VVSVALVKRKVNRLDGYLRARCALVNGDFLEVALHISVVNDRAVIDDYRYQWMDHSQTILRRRSDNSPHHPKLIGFPDHCHVAQSVEPARPMDLAALLDEVNRLVDAPTVREGYDE